MAAPLDEYRRKRDPERTPEAFGGQNAPRGGLFVVQQHAARAMHYDLRLEMGGVLKSWAVPKGPSVHSHEKRLAVHVEDHPLEYGDFEGVIPPDNYGAGAVILWDQGRFRLLNGSDPLDQLAQGTLEFELQGYKLRGRWMLVRMGRTDKEWLLFSKDGAEADAEPVEAWPASILSGLTVTERKDPRSRLVRMERALKRFKAPVAGGSRKPRPMLASLGTAPFSDPGWLFEIKYDGVRVLARCRDGAVTLFGRKGDEVTRRYPEIVHALSKTAPTDFLIDGEIVAMDEAGRPNFQRLQRRMHLTNRFDIEQAARTVPARGFFFDCLEAGGRDLRNLPLVRRKQCLSMFVAERGVVQYTEHIAERGEDFYHAASAQRLEGIIAKRADSHYSAGRSRDWVKFKCRKRQEFVIGGYTRPGGSRRHFGALHLGLYRNGALEYVSKVGTGFDQQTLGAVHQMLLALTRDDSPFAAPSPAGTAHRWVEPRLVCEVEFTDWTDDGGLRHPSFLGLRDDKAPDDCRREDPPESPAGTPANGAADPTTPPSRPAPSKLDLTNPDKVFWPADGYTKSDLIDYYTSIAPLLLPYLRDRPLVLTRFPDGIHGKSFFQKDAPDFVPDWVATRRIYSKDAERDIDYFIVNDTDTLRYVANLGTIPLHIWASRLDSLERPDWLVLDLDPKGAPFVHVVRLARELKRILDGLGVTACVKTSGATGLHLLVATGRRYLYEQCRTFARLLAMAGEQAVPDIATVQRPLHAREGKVYIDFGQNGYGRTIAAPFSVRPLPGAPVSCPLRWSEVTAKLDPGRFTIKTVTRRFAKRADPLLAVVDAPGLDMVEALARLEPILRNTQERTTGGRSKR